ncbi:hypothetical protein FQN57_006593 [Myotisia sp. PD_48]|nr:hypothetical protein FQN57_006593 [Myotisia sp. PD_48]
MSTEPLPGNWIANSCGGKRVRFPDGTRWQLDDQISEKWYIFNSGWHPQTDQPTAEAQGVYHCHQLDGPELNKEAIIKIRLQALLHLTDKKCSASPKLLSALYREQTAKMPVPGGYFLAELMEKLPGITLNADEFWSYDYEKRERIRAAFLLALGYIVDFENIFLDGGPHTCDKGDLFDVGLEDPENPKEEERKKNSYWDAAHDPQLDVVIVPDAEV